MLAIALLGLLGLANGQVECVYHQGGLTLDLNELQGRYFGYSDNGRQFAYSVCENGLVCIRDGIKKSAMVDSFPTGANECWVYGRLNLTTQPFFDFAISAWMFNYSNGEYCSDQTLQINRSSLIQWQCNPDIQSPFISDVFEYDACNLIMKIEWQGACVPPPPPNTRCEFRSGVQSLNLSTIQGTTLSYVDDHQNTWELTPCSNNLKCLTPYGQNIPVMSEVVDTEGQCIKYLAVWSGDAIPFYDRTIFGQDYWDFFWSDGQECGVGGPLQVLNARYYCNPSVDGATITKAGGVGPCSFRFDIDSKYACTNLSSNAEPLKEINQRMKASYTSKLDSML